MVDAQDRPLAVAPLGEVHRQRLFHRSVLVLVYNSEGKVYLQKRHRGKQLYPRRLDISATGHVQAGESREDAAMRELHEELGLRVDGLKLWKSLPASAETAYEFVTLFSAGKVDQEPRPCPEELEGGMFVDANELAYLVEQYRDMLTPGLVHFWETGVIFPNKLDPV